MPDGDPLLAARVPRIRITFATISTSATEGREKRFTRGARLTAPDARRRPDRRGAGSFRRRRPWSSCPRRRAPSRRSRRRASIRSGPTLDGRPMASRIAAVEQSSGRSEIVVLDTDGKVVDSFRRDARDQLEPELVARRAPHLFLVRAQRVAADLRRGRHDLRHRRSRA